MARTSEKAGRFTESVIRETFRLAAQYGAINLGQGYPDFPCPQELKDAACTAIVADDNQYPMTFGTPPLRAAIAEKTARTYPGWEIDPETELCVTCGATEALVAVAFALLDPGDEADHRDRRVVRARGVVLAAGERGGGAKHDPLRVPEAAKDAARRGRASRAF